MKKIACRSDDSVVGAPYSPAIRAGDTVYVSGQGPLSAATLQVTGDTFEEQAELTLDNLARALAAAGVTLDDCVKVNVYLADLAMFDRFNVIYSRRFREPYPARTTIQAVLWGGIQVEIDAVAIRQRGD